MKDIEILMLLDGNYIRCQKCNRLIHNKKNDQIANQIIFAKNSSTYRFLECILCLKNRFIVSSSVILLNSKRIEEVYNNQYRIVGNELGPITLEEIDASE